MRKSSTANSMARNAIRLLIGILLFPACWRVSEGPPVVRRLQGACIVGSFLRWQPRLRLRGRALVQEAEIRLLYHLPQHEARIGCVPIRSSIPTAREERIHGESRGWVPLWRVVDTTKPSAGTPG